MEIGEMTALEVGRRVARQEISIRDAVEAAWDAIEAKEEKLHCFITLDKEGAIARAERLQRELKEHLLLGERVGALYGVPFAVKDNLCTKGMRTSCGSAILEHFIPAYDATSVERLEKAGAVLLGKTNMDEFAMGSTTETSYFGLTRNPRAPEYSPGGSSGGSAAAVAAGECFFSLGSDTGGSVRQPASHCGVTGLKPTYGRVSRYGLLAYCSSMDQVGPLAKDSRDLEAILQVISGRDEKDGTSSAHAVELQTMHCGGQGLKIGILRDFLEIGTDLEVADTVKKASEHLQKQGAFVEDCVLGIRDLIVPTYYTIVCAEASSNLSRYDGVKYGLREDAPKLQDMYCKTRARGFGEEVKRRIMLGTFVLSEGFYDAYYLRALKVRRLIREALDQAFSKYDVLLCPVSPAPPAKLGEYLTDPIKNYMADVDTAFANLTGAPAISVPFGENAQGLPIGVQAIANLFEEKKLLQVAGLLEGYDEGMATWKNK